MHTQASISCIKMIGFRGWRVGPTTRGHATQRTGSCRMLTRLVSFQTASVLQTRCSHSWKASDYATPPRSKNQRFADPKGYFLPRRGIIWNAAFCCRTVTAGGRTGTEELSLCGFGFGRRAGCRHLQSDRQGETQWSRPRSISTRGADSHWGSPYQPD